MGEQARQADSDQQEVRKSTDGYKPESVPGSLRLLAAARADANSEQAGTFGGLAERGSKVEQAGVIGLGLVQLPARNLQVATDFYTRVLGFQRSHPERPVRGNVFFRQGLHLLETAEPEFRHLHWSGQGVTYPYAVMKTNSVTALRRKLFEAGVSSCTEPCFNERGGYFEFLDAEGHLLGVHQRVCDVGAPDSESDSNESASSPNVDEYGWTQIPVTRLERSLEFYTNVLGLTHAGAGQAGAGREAWLYTQTGDEHRRQLRLIEVPEDEFVVSHWTWNGLPKHSLEMFSADVADMYRKIESSGGRVTEQIDMTGCGNYLKFYDPDGHYFWVNQPPQYCR